MSYGYGPEASTIDWGKLFADWSPSELGVGDERQLYDDLLRERARLQDL